MAKSGPYDLDEVVVTDADTRESIALQFSQQTKKLISIAHDLGRFLSFKEFSPEEGSRAGHWKQHSKSPGSVDFHEIFFDKNGEITEDVRTTEHAEEYYDFPDEQAFMTSIKHVLEKTDMSQANEQLQATKKEILEYLDHNIQPANGKKLVP